MSKNLSVQALITVVTFSRILACWNLNLLLLKFVYSTPCNYIPDDTCVCVHAQVYLHST